MAAKGDSEIDEKAVGSAKEVVEQTKTKDKELWEEELRVRKHVAESGIGNNVVSAFFLNTYASVHIFAVYLISFESLLSIALSVTMTVCEFSLDAKVVGYRKIYPFNPLSHLTSP